MNAVFIHIPKTAGTHLKRALGLHNMSLPRQRTEFEQKGIVTFGHANYAQLVKDGKISKEFDDSAIKFTFCRNPFDRAVSHYAYVRKAHPELMPPEKSFLEFTRMIHIDPAPREHRRGRLRNGKIWYRKQVCSIRNVDMDFVGRYETLEEDKIKIADMIGSYVRPSSRLNRSRHEPYQTYYCDEAIANVQKYYEEDFEYFGYSNELH